MPTSCLLVEAHTVRQDGDLATVVPLVRRDEADAAVPMLGVVPGHKAVTHARAASRLSKGLCGYSGRYFSVRKSDSL